MILIIGVLCSFSAFAENDGYIVKTKDALHLFSAKKSSSLGDNLHRVDSISEAYRTFGENNIEKIFPNYTLELFDITYPEVTSDTYFNLQWNLSAIGAEAARKKGVFGRGVTIAVVDSGLTADHKDLNQNNILTGYNCIHGATDTSDITDNYGHGTAVTGIIASMIDNGRFIAGIADRAKIIPIKITDGKSLTLLDLFAGLKKAVELKCDIINLSLGGAITDQTALAELKLLIDEAEKKGITVVVAVGNGGTDINYPAGFDNVIGVSGTDSEGNVSVYSQQNNSIFIAAPGDNVATLYNNGSLAYVSGTSIATPHVTAAVALIKELLGDVTIDEIKEILKSTAAEAGDVGYDTKFGNGILNIGNIMELLDEHIPDILISTGVGSEYRIHIHNNGDAFFADAYLANYKNGALSDIEVACNIEVKGDGVTDISASGEYQSFFLWNKNLRPLIKKQNIGY